MENKIVFLGNRSDWCEKNLTDVKKLTNGTVINSTLPSGNHTLLSILAKIHYSLKINKIIRLPWKRYWFPYFVKNICSDKECNLFLIIYDRNRLANDEAFLEYVKMHYSNLKLIYLFTNIVKISGANENNFVYKLKDYYDVVYAFDPMDSPKYGFQYNPLIYSLNEMKVEKNNNQVFYVGRAKDRYDMLIATFEKLKSLGLHPKFYIVGVPEKQQKYKDEITYNKMIPYTEALRCIQQSGYLLDIIQGESAGFTIKVCEAVYYNKRLITTNPNIKDAPFYHSDYIRIMESPEDLTMDFFDPAIEVEYSEEGKIYFSVDTFIQKIKADGS